MGNFFYGNRWRKLSKVEIRKWEETFYKEMEKETDK